MFDRINATKKTHTQSEPQNVKWTLEFHVQHEKCNHSIIIDCVCIQKYNEYFSNSYSDTEWIKLNDTSQIKSMISWISHSQTFRWIIALAFCCRTMNIWPQIHSINDFLSHSSDFNPSNSHQLKLTFKEMKIRCAKWQSL